MENFIGTITKIIDPDLYTIEVDIPSVNEKLKAFPMRGEVDEPRVGDVVFLRELDPLYHSYYLYEKLKENNFIGIRARGKVLRMSSEEISIGIFDSSDESWCDKNDGVDPTPTPTSWLKIDSSGNMDISLESNKSVIIKGGVQEEVTGNFSLKVDGDGTIECSGSCTIKVSGDVSLEASGSCTIDSPNVTITGGNFNMKGTAAPGAGPMNCLPVCVFSGCQHGSQSVSGT